MKRTGYFLMLALMGAFGCTLMSPSSTQVKYGEDLSTHRPMVAIDTSKQDPVNNSELAEVVPENHETAVVGRKLAAITSQNKSNRTLPGYTIQVYSGTSRDDASRAKAKVYRILPDSRPETKYEQPIYKVRVGSFGDRLEAQSIYAELTEEFPDAIVIPSRIRNN